jgi:LysR family nitrogen assimilation transcriptional regulator
MDEAQLRAFLAIVECHSITKASEELGLAQPSLSQQLLRLEDELGVRLFDRTSRGVSPTAAGQLFKDHAEHILQSTRRAREELRRSTKASAGEVALGLPISLGHLMGHPLIRAARAEFPDIKLRIRQAVASDHFRRLEEGSLDVALVYYAEDLSHLPAEHIGDETLFLIGPPDAFGEVDADGIALKPADAEILRRIDLLMPPIGKGLLRRINQQPHGESIRLSIRTEIDSLPLLKSLLASGDGYSLLPHVGVRDELIAGALAAARVEGIDLKRTVSLVRTPVRPPSGASVAVEAIVKRIVEQMRSEGLWVVA